MGSLERDYTFFGPDEQSGSPPPEPANSDDPNDANEAGVFHNVHSLYAAAQLDSD
jgi:hypothetical protein